VGGLAVRLARGAADWLVDAADPADWSLYHGLAGVVLALHEADQHFGAYRRAVARGADALDTQIDDIEGCSLYFGLVGVAVALHALGRPADRALRRVRQQFDGRYEMFELFAGNAGIGLGALYAGDLDLAVMAVSPYLTTPTGLPAESTGRCGRPRPDRTTSRTARSASCTRSLPSATRRAETT
jgi:hypothetical protein